MLPQVSSVTTSPWTTFDAAREAIERIEPGRTTIGELRAVGIDPYANANVQLLSYSDVALRFPNTNSLDQPDAGLRQCLRAGKSCTGYAITARGSRRERIGNFFQDALGFKRVVEVTGWSFNAMVLLVDERVVYTLYGGQPKVHELEITRQPLGPIQNVGDAIGNLIK
jgi:hypothetical protein